jgi:hypothetical protein
LLPRRGVTQETGRFIRLDRRRTASIDRRRKHPGRSIASRKTIYELHSNWIAQ